MSDTPRTEQFTVFCNGLDKATHLIALGKFARQLELEISNMTDQRDAALQALEWAKKNHERELAEARETIADLEVRHAATMLHTQTIVDEANEFREQRDNAIAELEAWRSEKGPDRWWVKHEEYVAQRELWINTKAEVEQQRDRLAEALQKACAFPTCGNWYEEAQAALDAVKGRQTMKVTDQTKDLQQSDAADCSASLLSDEECKEIIVSACTVRPHTEQELTALINWASMARMDNMLVDMVLEGKMLVEWTPENEPRFNTTTSTAPMP